MVLLYAELKMHLGVTYMSIKVSSSQGDLITNLKNRKLHVNDTEAIKMFTKYNYFQLINGLENIFLDTTSPKTFKDVSLLDFQRLYLANQNISRQILIALDDFETRLKTSISYHFTQKHCNSINKTMEYTNKDNYQDISTIENYPLKNEQYARFPSLFSENKFTFFSR